MAKKRRSTTSKGPSGPRELNPEDAKMAAFNTWEDIPDEEDEFHISRDKVLLEGENVGRRRADEYGEVSDEEVLVLDNYIDDSEGESEGSEGSDNSEDEEEEEEEEEEEKAPKSKNKASSKKKQQQQEDTDDSDAAAPTDDEDEDAEGWGTSKKDYYGGDTIATEQDAALEAAEALRLQAKHAAALTEADYGFDEADWAAAAAKKKELVVVGQSLVVTEELPTAIPKDMGAEERTKLLEARHPEFRLLAEEFVELRALHGTLGLSAAAAEAVGETVRSSVAVVKFRALSAYLGVLSMYFAVLSSPETVQTQGARLREHGVMEGLVKCRKMWEAVKDLEVEAIRSEGGERKRKSAVAAAAAGAVEKKKKKKEPKRKRAKLSPAFSDSEGDSDSAPAAKTAGSSSKKTKKSAPVSDLSDLTALATSFRPTTTTKKASKKTPETSTSTAGAHDTTDFGDDSTLGALDAEQKAARRRNLRFYTSQIVSKSAKREAAGQSAGGDTDLPHRERRKEKELRMAAEAARRRNDGADLSDGDPDEEDVRVARQMREQQQQEEEEGSDNEYYDMLAGKARQKKAQKQAWHQAEKVGGEVRVVEEVAADGKRAVGYVIDKNKGLTPHRKKDVRNPRVKKRKKYEAAKKKLGSKKAVYKGGLQGSYGGEMTGIKKNLVKSVKFK